MLNSDSGINNYMLTRTSLFSLLFTLLGCSVHAQDIVATPGTYELLEGTTIQFDTRSNTRSGKVSSYRWRIITGKGATLVNADQARVTFAAPAIDEDKRLFTLQLELVYEKGKPSTAQLNIQVHKKTSNKKEKKRTSPWVSGTIGFGFGYLWGSWWPYPPLIVIPCPPPETIWPPEEVPPIAVPLPEDPDYSDWVAENPDIVAEYFDETDLTTDTMPIDETTPVADEVPMDLEIPADMMDEPEPAIIEPVPEPMPDLGSEPGLMDTPVDLPMEMDMPMDMDMDLMLD